MSTREQWLQDFATAARVVFAERGFPIPSNVRVAVGFPSTGRRGKRIGECWSQQSSADGHFEIFIHPTLAESARVADVLTHELAHAAVGLEAGHGPAFRACATAVGLVGKMTATTAGPGWNEWALPVLERLGALPHASLRGASSSGPKKQATRLLKCACSSCGFTFRASAKWVEGVALTCPDVDCGGEVLVA